MNIRKIEEDILDKLEGHFSNRRMIRETILHLQSMGVLDIDKKTDEVIMSKDNKNIAKAKKNVIDTTELVESAHKDSANSTLIFKG